MQRQRHFNNLFPFRFLAVESVEFTLDLSVLKRYDDSLQEIMSHRTGLGTRALYHCNLGDVAQHSVRGIQFINHIES